MNPGECNAIKSKDLRKNVFIVDTGVNGIAAMGEIRHRQMKKKMPVNTIDALKQLQRGYISNCLQTLNRIGYFATTAAGQWSFSTVRRSKSYIRSTTGENRSNGLAVMIIRTPLSTEDVIREQSIKSRRIKLLH